MRLLNAHNLELVTFQGRDIPQYAILSHTWGWDEVAFEDLSGGNFRRRLGFSKIEGCRKLALDESLEWLWVDTCCIDKSSSAELSEAINSMYVWYQRAAVCYVYLADVPSIPFPEPFDELAFRNSRWHTRGWTLQELLAPRSVRFYDASWVYMGSRHTAVGLISDITGIGVDFIENSYHRLSASIALKLSWASRRETSREEDMAYCLMGLLDVNMPLLYGEGGAKAFRRLQNKLIKGQHDHSILAYKSQPVNFAYNSAKIPLFAPSPIYFRHWSANVKSISAQSRHYFSTNLGLHITLPLILFTNPRTREATALALLECEEETTKDRVALPLLIEHRTSVFPVGIKCHDISPFMVPESIIEAADPTTIYLRDNIIIPYLQFHYNIRWSSLLENGYELSDYFPPRKDSRTLSSDGRFLSPEDDFLTRFHHKDRDDLLIIYRPRPCSTQLMKNGLRAFSGYAGITTCPRSHEERGGQQFRQVTSWELLLRPDFKRIDFGNVERSFRWNSSVDIVMDHSDYPGTRCRETARFKLTNIIESGSNGLSVVRVSIPDADTVRQD